VTESEIVEEFEYQGSYLYLLEALHAHLRPRTYVEIGVSTGRSITLVQPETRAIGIDPAPRIERGLTRATEIFAETSDRFFDRDDLGAILGRNSIELGFIDGMHQFEFAFRDFRNLERLSENASVILIHDCLPPNALAAAREPRSNVWAGDVWKLLVCLRDNRPDLAVHVVTAGPTGLGIVTNLDPSNRVLWENEQQCLDTYLPLTYDMLLERADVDLDLVPNTWDAVKNVIPAHPYQLRDPSADSTKRYPRTVSGQRRRARVWFSGTRIAELLRRVRDRSARVTQ
jgi:hypothetical protein